MTMGNTEIAVSYKTARNKTKQVAVLADLNCCSKEEIKNILKAEGLLSKNDGSTKRRGRQKKSVDTKEAAERLAIENTANMPVMIELKDEMIALPEASGSSIAQAIEELMDGAIEEEIRLYEIQIAKLQAKKKRLENVYRVLAAYLKE